MLLPGGIKQVDFFLKNVDVKEKNVLVLGSGAEEAAVKMLNNGAVSVEIVVEDYEQFLQSRLNLESVAEIEVKLMEFQSLDYKASEFDFIFAQASISVEGRNKIVKEIRRVLKKGGIFCSGEIVKLQKDVPAFVHNMFESSGLEPLFSGEVQGYYEQRKFELLKTKDLSFTLKEYYSGIVKKSEEAEKDLTPEEKSYYKKLLNRVHHESNVYLKLGGAKFIGFQVFLLKNNKENQ